MKQQRQSSRDRVPQEQKWQTAHLFANDETWHARRKVLLARCDQLKQAQGTLAQGKATVIAFLDDFFAARKELARLRSYAQRHHDEDTRQTTYQGLRDLSDKLRSDFAAATAFVEPELLALPENTLQQWIVDSDFADYDRFLTGLLRKKPHVLSQSEERLLAQLSLIAMAPHNAYATFSGAELKFPDIPDEQGKKAPLSQATFHRFRTSPAPRVRRRAFETFFGTLAQYRHTLATTLNAQLQAHLTFARARNYPDALTAALHPDELSREVYHEMIGAARRSLPLLHRYLQFRKERLGTKRLCYHDLYAPIAPSLRLRYPYDRAVETLLRAVSPLGKEYQRDLAKGLAPKSGWIDVRPTEGKRSGAYMDGSAYDVHPYVLLNHLDDYHSLSTLAHEMGHALHSYYSNQTQPYAKANYSIFVAEVASTVNEALLVRHLYQQAKTKKHRLFFLTEELEGFRLTFFRQALFAEFELEVYRRAEQGEPLTADTFDRIYLTLTRDYYGHDQGIVEVDPRYGVEWAYIPHFYYHYYVFQYVTGITAATALATLITDPKQGKSAAQRYIDRLLKTGDSAPPLEILRNAGVDLTTPAPYDLAMKTFANTLAIAQNLT